MQRRILLASILCFILQLSNAQNPCVFDSISPAPELGKICDLAYPICISALDGFSASIEKDTTFEQSLSVSCSPFSYVDWYNFNYCGDTLKIGITPNNCTDGVDSSGLFAGIFSGCSDAEWLVCDGTTTNGEEIILEVIGPNLGNVRLFVDGYSSSMCDYTIQVYEGIDEENSDTVVLDCERRVVGKSESCQGGVYTYSVELTCEDIEDVGGNGSSTSCHDLQLNEYEYQDYLSDVCYEWTITPEEGWEIIGDQNGPTININWFNEDSLYATNPDTFLIQRKKVKNPYFDERFGKFCGGDLLFVIDDIPLQVVINAPEVNQYQAEICEGEVYEFFGEVLTESGEYSWLDTTSCVLDVLTLFVKPSGQNQIVEYFTKCPSSCIEYNGMEYCDEGEFVVGTDECQNTFSIQVTNGYLNVDLQVSNMINCTNGTALITSEVSTDLEYSEMNYFWFFENDVIADGTESILVSEKGEYMLLVSISDDNGEEICNATASVTVDENFDKVKLDVQDNYTWNCDTEFLTLIANYDPTNAGDISWSTNQGIISEGSDSGSVIVNSAGLYYVEVEHPISGCTTIDSINVQDVEGILDVDYTATDLSCETQQASVFINNVEGGQAPYIYYVDNKEESSQMQFDKPGVYNYKVEDANGCAFEFDLEIKGKGIVSGDVQGNTSVIEGESINLSAGFFSSSDSILTYSWFLEDGTLISTSSEFSSIVDKSQVLTLVVEGANSCSITRKVFIEARQAEFQVFCPNVFTPNGDGLNDYFEVYVDKYTHGNIELDVFDRWGNIIYSNNSTFSHGESPRWDGKDMNGEVVMSGAYVYMIKFKVEDKFIRKNGTIALLR